MIKYILFAFVLLSALPVYGQTMNFGLRTGLGFSNFYNHQKEGEIIRYNFGSSQPPTPILPVPPGWQPPTSYFETSFIQDMRIGFFTYAFLNQEISPKLVMEVGLGYSQKGIDISYQLSTTEGHNDQTVLVTDYQFNRNLRLDYLMVPVTFHYKIGKAGKERFYLLGGIYNSVALAFLINKSSVRLDELIYSSAGDLVVQQTSEMTDDTTYARLFDTGLVGGFGFNLPITEKIILGIDLRSYLGLVNVPGKYQEHGFQDFDRDTRHINFEPGVQVIYGLR